MFDLGMIIYVYKYIYDQVVAGMNYAVTFSTMPTTCMKGDMTGKTLADCPLDTNSIMTPVSISNKDSLIYTCKVLYLWIYESSYCLNWYQFQIILLSMF